MNNSTENPRIEFFFTFLYYQIQLFSHGDIVPDKRTFWVNGLGAENGYIWLSGIPSPSH